MRRIIQSQDSMLLNRLPTEETIADKSKKKGTAKSGKTTHREDVKKILQIVIDSAVEESILRTRILEVRNFAVEFFGNCFESVVNLDSLSSKAPDGHMMTLQDRDFLFDEEPKSIDIENWNRGCVTVIERASMAIKSFKQMSAFEGDLNSNSFHGVEANSNRRASPSKMLTRPSLHSNRQSRVNINETVLKVQTPIQEEPIKLANEENSTTTRMSISNVNKRMVKLSQARSMSINSERLEEQLRQTKIEEIVSSSQIRQSIFGKIKPNFGTKGLFPEKKFDDKGRSGAKNADRTF
jgi:hypothetical protein